MVDRIDPANGTRDVRMIARAVRQKWDIDPRLFASLPASLCLIALDPKKPDRARLAAARSLIAMHGQNVDKDNPSQLHLHKHDEESGAVHDYSKLTDEQLKQLIELMEIAAGEPANRVVVQSPLT